MIFDISIAKPKGESNISLYVGLGEVHEWKLSFEYFNISMQIILKYFTQTVYAFNYLTKKIQVYLTNHYWM